VRSQTPRGESERAYDERWLAGRLTVPGRTTEACAQSADRLERLLATRGLIGDPHLPQGLVGRVRSGGAALVHHVTTLSRLTNLDLYESLRLFGYDLEDLPLLQAVLHRDRTVLLPTTIYDNARQLLWPSRFDEYVDLTRGEFLPELVTRFGTRGVENIDAEMRFLYLRLGRLDTRLVPTLVPGSIVQIDTTDRGSARFTAHPSHHVNRAIYAVAHLRGLSCSYVDWIDDERIALAPAYQYGAPLIYQVGTEAVVLGRIRMELRPMDVVADDTARGGHDHCATRLLRPNADCQTFGPFIRTAREALGMTHRDAHASSVRVAAAYGDPRFAFGVGTLSDWESQSEPPLYISHLLSLAACCAVSFFDLLRAARLSPADHVELSVLPCDLENNSVLPPALLHAARIAADLPDLGWDDVFRCGDGAPVFDRVMAGTQYVIVNRRSRRVPAKHEASTIDRPLYVLRDECGRQMCASCFVASDQLFIQPDPRLPLAIRSVSRNRITIRGRVVAALRRH